MKSFKEEIKNAIIEATASDRVVSFKAIANEYGKSHMRRNDVEDIKAAVLKAVPDFRAVMMYDTEEQMAHPERQSLFCGLHFVENGVEFETWSVHFPTPAESSAKENNYEWKKLMRKTKTQLLAEAQRLGSTVDSLTTRSKADLADYVIWLADREKTLTEAKPEEVELEQINRITEVYSVGDGFFVEVTVVSDWLGNGLVREAWLYHNGNGVKMLMFGESIKDSSAEEFLETVRGNLYDGNCYIEFYREQYM